MSEDPRETYRKAVEGLLGTRSGLADRVLHLAGDDGIARGVLLKRLKIKTEELDALLGAMLQQGAITLDVERTTGRPSIIVRRVI